MGVTKRGTASKGALLRLIKIHCLWCCGGSPVERRECTSHDCALWPHRMGNARPEQRQTIYQPYKIVDRETGETLKTSYDDFPECKPGH